MKTVQQIMQETGAKANIRNFRYMQENYTYKQKVRHAENVARSYQDKCSEMGLNCHVSVGGLDSITLHYFLETCGVHVPCVSCSSLEQKGVQAVHKQIAAEMENTYSAREWLGAHMALPQDEIDTITDPDLGLMASEGGRREKSLMMHGCNYYGKSTIRSAPFAIFSRQDILQLALDLNVPIPAEYGEIVRDKDGTLRTTLAQRTGCTMCGFGIQLEQRPNRFDRLRSANPKEWEFWMRHVCRDENGDWYGWGRVLDYIGVEWENEPGQLPGQMSIEDYQT